MPEGTETPLALFCAAAARLRLRPVLEIGTLQDVPGRSTHHLYYFPGLERREYVMADIAPGADVDVAADLHELPTAWHAAFGAFVAEAVFEHLARPWQAAKQVYLALKPGGYCYITTHQTFPLHGFPKDYFRFSREALALIFTDAGMDVIACEYSHRCTIVPPPEILDPGLVEAWNRNQPSYIIVSLVARKPDR